MRSKGSPKNFWCRFLQKATIAPLLKRQFRTSTKYERPPSSKGIFFENPQRAADGTSAIRQSKEYKSERSDPKEM